MTHTKGTPAGILLKTLSILAGILFLALPLEAQVRDSSDILWLGDEMPEFTAVSVDGKTLSSDDLYGKVVLINFMATWCPPCNQELPFVESDIWYKYKDRKDFVLMIIDREESLDKVKAFMEKKKFTMPFYLDEKREIYGLFAKKNIPRNYLFNKEGQLVLASMGYKKEEFDILKKELAGLLK